MESKENKIGHFDCACHDRDHMIKVSHFNWGPGDEHNIQEIDFNFVIHHTCWEANKNGYTTESRIQEKARDFLNFFRRIWWRIRKSAEILTTGSIKLEGNWSATEESFAGLRKWMNKTAKIIKQENGRVL